MATGKITIKHNFHFLEILNNVKQILGEAGARELEEHQRARIIEKAINAFERTVERHVEYEEERIVLNRLDEATGDQTNLIISLGEKRKCIPALIKNEFQAKTRRMKKTLSASDGPQLPLPSQETCPQVPDRRLFEQYLRVCESLNVLHSTGTRLGDLACLEYPPADDSDVTMAVLGNAGL